ILSQSAPIEFRFHAGIRENRLDLRSEKEGFAVPAVVEGLDSKAVPRRKNHALTAIPNHEGEHATQVLHAVTAILLIQVDDGFRVAARAVGMAPSLQPDSQLCMVINLTVEYDPDVLIFVGQRLMTTLDVDDAETPHGQANIFLDEEAFVIGPTMRRFMPANTSPLTCQSRSEKKIPQIPHIGQFFSSEVSLPASCGLSLATSILHPSRLTTTASGSEETSSN